MRYIFLFTLVLSTTATKAQTAQQQINLEVFAKLYGYVRFFHPSDEAASVNWDRFAVYGSSEVLNAKDNKTLVKKLKEIFLPIAPSLLIYETSARLSFNEKSITPSLLNEYKTIVWQHEGLGVQGSSIYRSMRLNRPKLFIDSAASYAPISQSFDATPYRGKQIKMKAWMKYSGEDEEGSGHFWLRVDKKNGSGLFYNMSDNPVTEDKWKEYEFTGVVDTDADTVYFGAYLNGAGKLWADDFLLQVQSEKGWETIPIRNNSFEDSQSRNLPAAWSFGSVRSSGKEIKGYTATNNTAGRSKDSHSLLIMSIKPDKSTIENTPLFIDYPKPGEIVKKELTKGIEIILPLALYGNEYHTYPRADSFLLNKLQTKLSTFYSRNNTSGNNLYIRLGSVVIAWNVLNHFSPYWEYASQTPAAILTNSIQKALKDKTALDFKQTLLLMTEPLNDGHVVVELQGDTSQSYIVPALLSFTENKIVVDKIMSKDVVPLLAGDIVEIIDGKNALQLFHDKKRFISGSPQWKTWNALIKILEGSKNSVARITVLREGRRIEIPVYRTKENLIAWQLKETRRESGWVKEGVYYLDLDKVRDVSITKMADTLSKAKALICDLRGYPPENRNIINHLLTKEEDVKWEFFPQITRPDYDVRSFSEFGWNMKPQNPHFSGKIIYIADGRAISRAESCLAYIKDFKLATIVGAPTAGTNGEENFFILPGGYFIVWTGALVKKLDGARMFTYGIIPDVPVERTIKGIKEGRDEFFEKALELAQQ